MRGRVALVVPALLLALTAAAEEARQPRVRVGPPSFDFGRVLPEKTLRKEFRLGNIGEAPLVIERISRSCGCTTATASASTLESGDSTRLLVEVQTPATPGRVRHQVLVRTNDPETPTLQIELSATVVAASE